MRLLSIILLLAGALLFAGILYQTDLAEVWGYVQRLSWWGIAAIFALYLVAVSADVFAWLLTFRSLPVKLGWFFRLWRVHVAGDALNSVTPGAPFGGEPVKAALLNGRYGIRYHEIAATWVLMQTILVGSQLIFLVVAVALMSQVAALPGPYKTAAFGGLALLTFCVVMFFVAQRYRFLSRLGRWSGRTWLGVKALRAVRHIRHVEGRIIQFYVARGRKCAAAVSLEFCNWLLGAVEIYLIMWLLDSPITLAEAWVIEGVVLLVRTVFFLIPAGVGVQEGAFIIVCQAITGVPTIGVAVALIRRFRELVWIFLGLAVAGRISLRRKLPQKVGS